MYRIILISDQDECLFNICNCTLELKSENLKDKFYTKKYFKLDKYNIEIIIMNLNNYKTIQNLNLYNEKCIIIIKRLNDINLELIKKIYDLTNPIILDIDGSLINKSSEDILTNLNNVIALRKDSFTKKNECYNMVLISIFDNYDFIKKQLNLPIIICGYQSRREELGKISLNILKSCEDIHKWNKFVFNLNLRYKLNLQELTYIKDPLNEYINDKAEIIIKQITNNVLDEKIYYSLILSN